MKTTKFKTNIKCGGCVATVTPFLNEAVGNENWQVDTANPDKILSISQEHAADESVVKAALQKAGFKAEKI